MKPGIKFILLSLTAIVFLFSQCKKEEESAEKPKVTTADVTNIAQQTATCGGNVTDDGGADITARGICVGSSANPTLDSCMSSTTNGTGTGAFTSNITGLAPNFTYYVAAYATNKEGTSYGESKEFKTIVK
ncbi:MAG: hypothetical protein K9J13_17365 [Saprospiraceae bacterium]|nr:hypothetical protein [Saprospiraceae bacterium]